MMAEKNTRAGEWESRRSGDSIPCNRRHADTPTPRYVSHDPSASGIDRHEAPPPHRILIVAGEVSGDKHAAKLIAALKEREPRLEIYAAGGEKMKAAGATLLHNLVKMAVLGSVEVLRNYRALRKIFYAILAFVREQHLDAVILVDYPGFNIRLAKKIKKTGLGTKVIYYISPQVWAWGTRRKWTISKHVDRMIAILPFEKQFYSDTEMPVDFVGHPLLDDLKLEYTRAETRKRWGLGEQTRVVALLPGSRWNEVRRHLPVMLRAAELMKRELPELEFATCEPPSEFRSFTMEELGRSAVTVRIGEGSIYGVIDASDLALVASGTATLETACLLKPMVIVYRVSWLTYFLGRALVKLPYIGMVNVIAGRKIMPECIQGHATPERIADTALDLLRDERQYAAAVEKLRGVRAHVGDPGASVRAARVVLAELGMAGVER
ncbi:MAG: lipid-A-disaccharide synthase [Candidatus Aureabacteria bacterium]|nr:lipid-A-disaccharide synthase [Candidatus Auribacterota bacterium]